MNINRNNYESLFLLYTDNELSPAERKAVELFVKDNADLQQELYMLQCSILQPEAIGFNAKNSLLKSVSFSLATEEKLLLYIDNELSGQEVKELKEMVAADGQLISKLDVLKHTKLLADSTIIFPDKSLLYRKEHNRIIPFGWWKMAAAAIFIGFGIWGMTAYVNRQTTVPSSSVAIVKTTPSQQTATQTPQKKLPEQLTAVTTPLPETKKVIVSKKVTEAMQIKKQPIELPEEKTFAKKEKEIKPGNNLPTPYFEKIDNAKSNQQELATVIPSTQKNNLAENNGGNNKAIKQSLAENNIYTAAFSETDNDKKQDQFTFSDDEPRKSKLSGFLRKATRLLERNTKMKPGDNNVKVANLEFAIQ